MAKIKIFSGIPVFIMGLLIHLAVSLDDVNDGMLEEIPSLVAGDLGGSGGEEISLFGPNNDGIIKLDAFEVLAKERDFLPSESKEDEFKNERNPLSAPDDDSNKEEVKVSGLGMELLRGAKELPGEIINKVSHYRDELHETVEDYRDKLHDKVGDYRDKVHEIPKDVWNRAKEVPKKIWNIPKQIPKLWKKAEITTPPDEESGSRKRGGFFGFGL